MPIHSEHMAVQPVFDGAGSFLVGAGFGGGLMLLFALAGWNPLILVTVWAVVAVGWVLGRNRQKRHPANQLRQ
ncbi:MAG TPA: hypothetical protein VG013_24630 [Gemmataceae bacterium]|jgi:hypothetical protein|nr:hypothetical protein [Gemmataceae bacterium]